MAWKFVPVCVVTVIGGVLASPPPPPPMPSGPLRCARLPVHERVRLLQGAFLAGDVARRQSMQAGCRQEWHRQSAPPHPAALRFGCCRLQRAYVGPGKTFSLGLAALPPIPIPIPHAWVRWHCHGNGRSALARCHLSLMIHTARIPVEIEASVLLGTCTRRPHADANPPCPLHDFRKSVRTPLRPALCASQLGANGPRTDRWFRTTSLDRLTCDGDPKC
jgi:hypothetical protein